MPFFKILSCRLTSQKGLVEFVVQPVKDEVGIGDTFLCWDTHHPIQYLVREIHKAGEQQTLICEGWMAWDDQFAGKNIDTSRKSVVPPRSYKISNHEAS